jgi:hypothetical protein
MVGLATLATMALVFVLSLQLRRREIETMRKIGGEPRPDRSGPDAGDRQRPVGRRPAGRRLGGPDRLGRRGFHPDAGRVVLTRIRAFLRTTNQQKYSDSSCLQIPPMLEVPWQKWL